MFFFYFCFLLAFCCFFWLSFAIARVLESASLYLIFAIKSIVVLFVNFTWKLLSSLWFDESYYTEVDKFDDFSLLSLPREIWSNFYFQHSSVLCLKTKYLSDSVTRSIANVTKNSNFQLHRACPAGCTWKNGPLTKTTLSNKFKFLYIMCLSKITC